MSAFLSHVIHTSCCGMATMPPSVIVMIPLFFIVLPV